MDTTALQISSEVVDRAVVVRATGEIDGLTAGLWRDSLGAAAATVIPPGRLVADLSGVTFLASDGLSVLVDVHRRCRDRGTPLIVVANTRVTTRLLTITGLDRLLDVVASFEQPPPLIRMDQPSSA